MVVSFCHTIYLCIFFLFSGNSPACFALVCPFVYFSHIFFFLYFPFPVVFFSTISLSHIISIHFSIFLFDSQFKCSFHAARRTEAKNEREKRWYTKIDNGLRKSSLIFFCSKVYFTLNSKEELVRARELPLANLFSDTLYC